MTAYLLVLAIVSAYGAVSRVFVQSSLNKRVLRIFSYGTLILFMGLRSAEVGTDTQSYSSYYIRIAQSNDPSVYMDIVNSAPVYSAFNKLLGYVSNDPQLLVFIVAVITCTAVGYFIATFSDNEPLSIFLFVSLYFYINCFNGMRQGLALALCLASYALAYKRRSKILVLSLLVVAVGVHLTSAVTIPFFIALYAGKVEKLSIRFVSRLAIAIVLASVAIALFSNLVFSWLASSTFGYEHYVDMLTSDRYATSGRMILRSLFYAVIAILFYFCMRANSVEEVLSTSRDGVIFVPALFGVCLSLAFADNYLIGERIAMYLTVFMVVLIPNLSKYLKNTRIIYLMVVVAAAIVLYLVLLAGDYAGVTPYRMG